MQLPRRIAAKSNKFTNLMIFLHFIKQMEQTKQYTGIILCGGKSRRMGKNKALLELRGKYIISQVIDILLPLCNEIIISTNSKELDFLGYRTVSDEKSNIGPIAGIYSALKASKTNKNIIVSCDTPFINSGLLKKMQKISQDFEIVLPIFHGYLQPITGIFDKSILPLIEKELSQRNYIPPRIFEKCNLNKLKIDNASSFYNKHLFFNVNSPEDYQKAQEIIKLNNR
jgi:molybdopterin-guanine dinucleotide biosynthesis protein A